MRNYDRYCTAILVFKFKNQNISYFLVPESDKLAEQFKRYLNEKKAMFYKAMFFYEET
jgi:hypothetical protein